MAAPGDAQSNTSSTQRVKVYCLDKDGKWDDRGTGLVSLDYVERSEELGLYVVDEDDHETLLVHRISTDDIYRKQEDTIISWREPEGSTELALSFQETAGCSHIWNHICTMQRNLHFSSLNMSTELRELPDVDISNLPQILEIVTESGIKGQMRLAGLMLKDKLFFGQEEIAIPVHAAIEAACAAHPTADVFINFASFRRFVLTKLTIVSFVIVLAAASSMAALKQPTIKVVAIIAEGVPESDTKQLIAYARADNKVVIGPATVGGIQAGAFKIGDTAGTIDNIIQCKLYRPGSVGFVSKSGGMSNEMYNTVARVTDGIYEGIAIGGDVFPGSTLSDHILRFNNIPQIKMMVVLGELGGRDEYSLVEALKQGKVNKPVVAWVSGTCARLFKSEVQFGHAGAKSGGEMESAQAKNQALMDAGAIVPTSFEALESAIKETFEKLVEEGKVSSIKEVTPPQIPEDLSSAIKSGKVRAPTHIISTISDDRGEEPCYAGVPMSSIIEQGLGVGDVISLLWFKRSLPRYCTKFIEICIMLCADHGPCVSGAHNTIVTARAGKDLVSSLVSGLLTIGPRFGGAIDDAARYFKDASDRNLTPYEFVEGMKKKGIRVPGIGHRIKSRDNRDKRVELLQKFARSNFPSVKYMEYAVTVESYTLSKANNLVLNVDGAIGSLFLDLLAGSGMFTKQEIDEIVQIGYLNGLFVLARSIGLIGHTFDQKRLKQPLYRHPWEDVLYTK
ncbi:unnamed protein product [Brassica rapa subsp. trilocularis]